MGRKSELDRMVEACRVDDGLRLWDIEAVSKLYDNVKSLESAGNLLGITRERVRQLLANGHKTQRYYGGRGNKKAICGWCSAEFNASQVKSKYCSDTCSQLKLHHKRDSILAHKDTDLSVREIAKKAGVHEGYASNILCASGANRSALRDPSRGEKVIKMWLALKPWDQIADALGYKNETSAQGAFFGYWVNEIDPSVRWETAHARRSIAAKARWKAVKMRRTKREIGKASRA